MFRHSSLARVRALTALVVTACILLGSGCTPGMPNQPGAKLAITATQPSGTYQPGDDIAFRVTVTNTGTSDVTSLSISTTLDAKVSERSLTCTGLGLSATGPGDASCQDFIFMQRLAAGASATLDFVATVHGGSQGTITNSFSTSVISGPAAVTAGNSATIVDTRSGTYQVFASNGQTYSLAADFASATATFSGVGANVLRPFALTSLSTDTYFFTSATGMRVHHDLLAGTVDLGGGVTPFIAGRAFVTTIAALDGQAFNIFDIDTPASGATTSRFLSTAFSGTAMLVCADAAPHTVDACPAGSLLHYDLSVADGVFTGVDAVHGDTATFQVAQSGSAMILLRAQATATGRLFQVGLSTNTGISATHAEGGDTLGRWGPVALAPPDLTEGLDIDASVQGTLSAIAGAPAGLRASFLGAISSAVYVAEDNGLVIVLGQPGSAIDGLMQVFDY